MSKLEDLNILLMSEEITFEEYTKRLKDLRDNDVSITIKIKDLKFEVIGNSKEPEKVLKEVEDLLCQTK